MMAVLLIWAVALALLDTRKNPRAKLLYWGVFPLVPTVVLAIAFYTAAKNPGIGHAIASVGGAALFSYATMGALYFRIWDRRPTLRSKSAARPDDDPPALGTEREYPVEL